MNYWKYLTNWKYRYFFKKISGVKKMVLDFEFKRYKTRELREEVRQEYDQQKSRLSILEEQIKAQKEKPTMEAGEIARLDDRKVLLEKEIEKYVNRMKVLDVEVSGSNPTSEYPEGVQGTNQQIDALKELEGMLWAYIKNL